MILLLFKNSNLDSLVRYLANSVTTFCPITSSPWKPAAINTVGKSVEFVFCEYSA